jgi:glutaredoxin
MPVRPVVTLYTRQGCSLCDEAEGFLRRLAPRLGFELQSVDIESDDALLRRYMFEIPVVALGDREVAKAPIYARALEEALADALTSEPQSR